MKNDVKALKEVNLLSENAKETTKQNNKKVLQVLGIGSILILVFIFWNMVSNKNISKISSEKTANDSKIEKNIEEESNSKIDDKALKEESKKLTKNEIISLSGRHFKEFKKNLTSRNTEISGFKSYIGDYTGDGIEDVVINYGIEPTDGGNWHTGGLMLYKNVGNDISFIQNYSPDYSFTFNKISGGNIIITKDDYADEDPRCCPSLHKTIKLKVNGSKIIEN